jgi:hypothetical protein
MPYRKAREHLSIKVANESSFSEVCVTNMYQVLTTKVNWFEIEIIQEFLPSNKVFKTEASKVY